MKDIMNRRMFLRGAGGAIMAIPFLPSLTSKAFAADPGPGPIGKCFMAIFTDHGGIWGSNQYPSDALLTQTMNYAGRNVRYGDLPSTPDSNGNVVLSPMYTASAQTMTPALVKKFNVFRGLDVPYRIGHCTGIQLGNFAATSSGRIGDDIVVGDYHCATIDQFMAHSPSFYSEADLTSKMTQRSFCVGGRVGSWGFSSPSTQTGKVVQQPGYVNNKELFDFFFNPGATLHNISPFIIDRVKASYDRLKKNPRISKGDLARLNQHMERMFEIERKMTVAKVLGAPPIDKPTTDSNANFSDEDYLWSHKYNAKYCHLMNDIIVAAFQTGTSRVGSWLQTYYFSDEKVSDWHGTAGHSLHQNYRLPWNQGTFEHAMVDLAAKMDAVTMADGKTLLDHSLIMLTTEAGQYTHQTGCVNHPLVMAGGAGGYFNTGMFVDFCDTTKVYDDLGDDFFAWKGNSPLTKESPGLLYQQWLANALMSMGVPASEWETFTEVTELGPKKSNPTKGYGYFYVKPLWAKDYAKAKLVMSDKLPVIT